MKYIKVPFKCNCYYFHFQQICSNWENFYDHESGIAYYLLGVGTERNTTDVAELIRVDHQIHEACVILEDELLEHGKTYYNILYAFNSGHKQLNVSAASDGGNYFR